MTRHHHHYSQRTWLERNAKFLLLGLAAIATTALVVIALTYHPSPRVSADTPHALTVASPTPTPVQEVISPSQGRQTVVAYLLGDSYSAGAGADADEGFVPVMSAELGWDTTTVSLSGGGYLNIGVDKSGPFSAKVDVAQLKAVAPDIVILQGGINDKGLDSSKERAGVADTIKKVRSVLPKTPIAVIGLLQPTGSGEAYVERTRVDIRAAAKSFLNVLYVDPSTWTYPTISDGIHPTTAGHAAIAQHIVAAFRDLGLIH